MIAQDGRGHRLHSVVCDLEIQARWAVELMVQSTKAGAMGGGSSGRGRSDSSTADVGCLSRAGLIQIQTLGAKSLLDAPRRMVGTNDRLGGRRQALGPRVK